jgi:hypothetical protein
VSKPKNDNRTAPKYAPRATARRPHPWADVGGVDYGPAIAAIGDLVTWAFDLAAADVADWPEGRRRVRATRRYVLARLGGRRVRGVPSEDVLFTAGLLARVFEAEAGLGMSEMVAVLDRIGLPTEVVPLMPRVQPHARMPLGRPSPLAGSPHATRRAPAPPVSPEIVALFRDAHRELEAKGLLELLGDEPEHTPCDQCGNRPRHRNAA